MAPAIRKVSRKSHQAYKDWFRIEGSSRSSFYSTTQPPRFLPFLPPFSRVAGGSSAATIACGPVRIRHLLGAGSYAHLIEHILQLVLGQRRAFNIFDSTEVLGHPFAVLLPYGRHPLLGELLFDRRVLSKIDLGPNNQAGNAGTVVVDLWEPLLSDVFKRCGGCDGEANEEDVGLWV